MMPQNQNTFYVGDIYITDKAICQRHMSES